MDALYNPVNDDAFRRHLHRARRSLSLKAEEARETTHYIWRTAGDGKVRPSHAANEGRVFAWDAPPPTGRPGEDFNCRCWAEPYRQPTGLPDDPPLEDVFPETILLPGLRIGWAALLRAYNLLRRIRRQDELPENLTDHGKQRTGQRNITERDIEEAIATAKENGNVAEKVGKYGTKQLHYRGSNGVTVVIETQGRNAGKVITV